MVELDAATRASLDAFVKRFHTRWNARELEAVKQDLATRTRDRALLYPERTLGRQNQELQMSLGSPLAPLPSVEGRYTLAAGGKLVVLTDSSGKPILATPPADDGWFWTAALVVAKTPEGFVIVE